MKKQIAAARCWQQRGAFARGLLGAPDPSDAAAWVALARWGYCRLRGLTARTCGGRPACAPRFSPRVGIGGANSVAKGAVRASRAERRELRDGRAAVRRALHFTSV